MPVVFDTHQLITRLTAGEMSLSQAEAVSAALQEALEASVGQLATRADLEGVRQDLTQLGSRLTWMIGANWALTLLILGKLVLFTTH